jgi:hypothetical protein
MNSPKRGSRPSLISDDFLQKIEGEIHTNQRRMIRELHHIIPEVSKTTIHEAVTQKLRHKKLYRRSLPKMLMDVHKTKQMGSTLKFLMRYAQEEDVFLDSIVIGDKTWVFHHTAESKQKSVRCKKFMTWFRGQAADFRGWEIRKLVPRLNKCLDIASNYVEKYVKAIYSQCHFLNLKNCTWLRLLYLYFPDMPCT